MTNKFAALLLIGMASPYQILDLYGSRHTCHTASGALAWGEEGQTNWCILESEECSSGGSSFCWFFWEQMCKFMSEIQFLHVWDPVFHRAAPYEESFFLGHSSLLPYGSRRLCYNSLNVTYWFTIIFVTEYMLRCDKVCNACYSRHGHATLWVSVV